MATLAPRSIRVKSAASFPKWAANNSGVFPLYDQPLLTNKFMNWPNTNMIRLVNLDAIVDKYFDEFHAIVGRGVVERAENMILYEMSMSRLNLDHS